MAAMVGSWSADKKHSDKERWICIYPAYINSKKTIAEGRRIAKQNCVENPSYQEIRDVLVAAGLKVGVENKLYSREKSKENQFRGRIRVQLKNDDGSVVNSSFPTRDSLLVYLGTNIPRLKTRQHRNTEQQPHQQTGTQSTTKGKGKKGKR